MFSCGLAAHVCRISDIIPANYQEGNRQRGIWGGGATTRLDVTIDRKVLGLGESAPYGLEFDCRVSGMITSWRERMIMSAVDDRP